MRFSDLINKLIFRGGNLQIDVVILKIMMNKVIINLNMFSVLVKKYCYNQVMIESDI